MSDWTWLDDRPVMVVIAGPNGAGKTVFYHTHLAPAGLPLVNADRLAVELDIGPYEAARVADNLRQSLVGQRESFAFETVFSDPVGEKIRFIQETAESGYTVALCFVALSSAKLSAERVAMRVSQGGHDVPADKLKSRYPRSLANLKAAIERLSHVLIFDNSDLARPYRSMAVFDHGTTVEMAESPPTWFRRILSKT